MKKKKKKAINHNIRIANVTLLFVLFLFAFLLYRVGELSLSETVDGINLQQFANNRKTRHETIYAKRGTIYDVNGEELALNVYSYTLIAYLTPSRGEGNYVKNKEETAQKLATVLPISEERILTLLNSKNSQGEPLYQTEFGSSGKGLTELTKDKIVALNLDGIDFIESQKRYYPKGDFLSYTLGYAKSDENGKIKGEMGIEALFDEALTGTDGFREYQKDLKGYKIANTEEKIEPAQDGNNVYLTIDSNVQFFVEQALEDAKTNYRFDEMNIVVADAKTGKILGIGSSTSFDPNIKNITTYLDPNISVAFEPGSTMKIFTYMAALETGKYNGEDTFQSGVYTTSDGTEIGDSYRKGWGKISFDKGFALSSNVGVINMINRYMNRDILMDYFKKLGFGAKTGIELSKETAGKLDFHYETEVYNAGFGQGIMVTSLQNIKALTAVANDGILLEPYIVEKVVDSEGNIIRQNQRTELGRVAKKETTDKIKDLMESVVTEGTGSIYQMPGYGLIAKTGTAQIASTNGKGYLTGPYDVIRGFAGMFPKEDPKIIIYANLKRPNPNTAVPLEKAIKSIVENISKYYNIYDEEEENEKEIVSTIASYMNHDVEAVKQKLEAKNLNVVVIGDGNVVINQYPEKGIVVVEGSKVFLKTNGANILLPDFTNWSKKEAMIYLEEANIPYTMNGIGYVVSQNLKGTVYEQGQVIELNLAEKYLEK